MSEFVLQPEGEVAEQTARDLQLQLLGLTGVHSTVVLDLTKVTYFGSDGVTALVVATRDANKHGHRVRVQVSRGSIVHRVLHICRVPFEITEADDG